MNECESDDVVVVVVEFCFDSITGISSNPSHMWQCQLGIE